MTGICCAQGCVKPSASGGYCSMHRSRLARHGVLEPPPRPTRADLYQAYVIRTTEGCWGWSGPISGGYGRVGHAWAHRVSFEIHRGPIPDGAFVLHACDNPPCTNPEHLSLGDQARNMAEAATRGRLVGAGLPGERNPHARLTNAQVAEIRRRRAAGERNDVLAAEFGTTRQNITGITTGARRKAG